MCLCLFCTFVPVQYSALPAHLDTKALSLTRVVCGFEAWPLVAQVGELAEDDQASAAGVAACLLLDANDVFRGVVVEGHLVGVVVFSAEA